MKKEIKELFENQLESNHPLTEEALSEVNSKKKELMVEHPDKNLSELDQDRVGQVLLFYMVFRDETDDEYEGFKKELEAKGTPAPESKGAVCEMITVWDDELDDLQDKVDNGELEFFDMADGSGGKMFPRFKRTDMNFDMNIKNQT